MKIFVWGKLQDIWRADLDAAYFGVEESVLSAGTIEFLRTVRLLASAGF